VVAGEFWQSESDYMKQIKDLDICDMVTIRADYIPDSEAGLYFEAADFFVAPYLEGTQSGSIKLAMGYRLPIVVTEIITDPMIQEYSIGRLIVPPGDALTLAKAMRNISQTKNEDINNENFAQESWHKLITSLTMSQNSNTTWL
jgi:glycosyltransferase involved in cell wall biosynthesis